MGRGREGGKGYTRRNTGTPTRIRWFGGCIAFWFFSFFLFFAVLWVLSFILLHTLFFFFLFVPLIGALPLRGRRRQRRGKGGDLRATLGPGAGRLKRSAGQVNPMAGGVPMAGWFKHQGNPLVVAFSASLD